MTTYSSTKAVPYVYICTHKETNQFYIGYRMRNVKFNRPSHLDLPEYKTSSKIVNPDFHDYTWTIVAEFFDPNHAYTFEQQLICDNWENPLLLNGRYHLGENQFRRSGPRGPNGMKGKPQSPDHIKKRTIRMKGKPSKRKGKPSGRLGIPNGPNGTKGKPFSDERKQNMRAPKSDEHKQNLRKPKRIIECPHCGIIGGSNAMTRYHFDNCKKKPVDQ